MSFNPSGQFIATIAATDHKYVVPNTPKPAAFGVVIQYEHDSEIDEFDSQPVQADEADGSHRTKEFRTVQIAKALHRLASGYHRVWEFQDQKGRSQKIELHAFPRSSGPVLRLIGKVVEQACEWVVEKHLYAVLALKVKRYKRHPALRAVSLG